MLESAYSCFDIRLIGGHLDCQQAVAQDEKTLDPHFGSKAASQAADALSGQLGSFFSYGQSSGGGSELTLQSVIDAVQQSLQVCSCQPLVCTKCTLNAP